MAMASTCASSTSACRGRGASIDADNWWPEFAPAVTNMRAGDYLGLHEYWGSKGPTDLEALPWLVGKHKLLPLQRADAHLRVRHRPGG